MLLRAGLVWILLAVGEVMQGVLRVRLLNRRVGDRRARQIGVGIGTLQNFALTWLTLPWLGVQSEGELLAVGLGWLVLMLAFDVIVGRYVFSLRWSRIGRDFDPRTGSLLSVGMLALALSPWLAAKLPAAW